jgi:hypothetical protein
VVNLKRLFNRSCPAVLAPKAVSLENLKPKLFGNGLTFFVLHDASSGELKGAGKP